MRDLRPSRQPWRSCGRQDDSHATSSPSYPSRQNHRQTDAGGVSGIQILFYIYFSIISDFGLHLYSFFTNVGRKEKKPSTSKTFKNTWKKKIDIIIIFMTARVNNTHDDDDNAAAVIAVPPSRTRAYTYDRGLYIHSDHYMRFGGRPRGNFFFSFFFIVCSPRSSETWAHIDSPRPSTCRSLQ